MAFWQERFVRRWDEKVLDGKTSCSPILPEWFPVKLAENLIHTLKGYFVHLYEAHLSQRDKA